MADDGPDDWIAPSGGASQSSAIPTMHVAPDNGPDDWIAPQAQPPRSVASDIGHGVGKGAVEGAGALAGTPSDIGHIIDRAFQWGTTKTLEHLGVITPEQGAGLREPITYTDDNGGKASLEESAFGSEAINRHLMNTAKSLGADTSPTQTVPGQYAETMTSFLPGAALGASSARAIPRALAEYGVLPGATSETAGQLTEGTAAEPYARIAGAIAPAALGMGARRIGRMANPMGKTMEGVTQQQMQDAQQLLDDSRAAGAPLTTAEAIQRVTGSATRLGDLQRVAEQSPQGGSILKPFFAQRPQQTEALGRSTMDQIAPPVTNPYGVAPRVQAAAEADVNAADKARSAAVKPSYQAAATDQVPVQHVDSLLGKIDTMIVKDKTGLISPRLKQLRDALTDETGTPITDIENLDNARKYFRDQIAQPAIAQDAIPKQVGAKMGSVLDELDTIMEQASPNFVAGKQRYQDITRNTIEPLQQSPLGQLAEAPGFEKQAQILFGTNPLPGSQAAVGQAVRQIAARDPQAAQQIARMYAEKVFNEATQANMPGGNQFGGPKFAAVLAGNPQQAANLKAAITALPNGNTRWEALNRSLEIFAAMGTRQPVGSQTAFNQQIAKSLEGLGAMSNLAATAASPRKWLDVASDVYQKYAFERNTAALAKAMISGDIMDLRRVVSGKPNSVLPQAALIALLAKEGATAGSGNRPP